MAVVVGSEFLGLLSKRRLLPLRPAWSEAARAGEDHNAVGSWWVPGVVVRGSVDGLYAVDTETGALAWHWSVPGQGVLAAMSDQVVDGVGLAVHGHEEDGRLFGLVVTAFGVRSGEQFWSYRPRFGRAPCAGRGGGRQRAGGAPGSTGPVGGGAWAAGGGGALLVLDGKGELTARIPRIGAHGSLQLDVIGIEPDRPVLAVGELVVVPTSPLGAGSARLTAFDRNGGGVRWSWGSMGSITGLAREGDRLLVLNKWVAQKQGQSDGMVRLHVLEAGTGRVVAVRRLTGYQVGMSGRLRLDGDRLIRISRWGGGGMWHPTEMYRLR